VGDFELAQLAPEDAALVLHQEKRTVMNHGGRRVLQGDHDRRERLGLQLVDLGLLLVEAVKLGGTAPEGDAVMGVLLNLS
jgi:hypothetical protein